MSEAKNTALRSIPAVETVLREPSLTELVASLPQPLVVEVVRGVLERAREVVRRSQRGADRDALVSDVRRRLELYRAGRPAPVINATGVILHTNLGRAVLGERVARRLAAIASGYCDLELTIETGERGHREEQAEELLRALTGAEAALVVNNCAAAVLLLLDTFARGKDVVVSRGELIEIGGAFRIPDVLTRSGAHMIEVGTTNKTKTSDYVAALTPETAVFLKVHTSNFRIIGFTEAPSTADLVRVANEHGVLVVRDLGSGAPGRDPGDVPESEPTLRGEIAAGAHLVAASGDKLLGGPQAGIIVGQRELVREAARNPLYRALRPDKLTFAALSEVSLAHLAGEAARDVPAIRMLAMSGPLLEDAARALARELGARLSSTARVATEPGCSEMGGGAMPGVELPTTLVTIEPRRCAAHEVEERLRSAHPPVLVRVHDGKVVIDPRTLMPGESDTVCERLFQACSG